jgi:triphosphatase
MEIEFKFQIPNDALEAVDAALRSAPCTRTHLQARYFDTADGALAARGVALRLRKEGATWVQTCKALGDGPLHRLEHNVDLGPGRKGSAPTALPARHDGTPVGDRLQQVLGPQPAPLVEIYGTDIWRLVRTEQFAGSSIELALDQGRVLAPSAEGGAPRSAQVCELELELVQGDVRDLTALAKLWAERHGLWFSTVSKAERGLRLAHGQSTRPAVKATAPQFADGGGFPDGPAIQRAVVAACMAQILPNATEVAAGSDDAAQVHQLRVGLRRLRTALRELAPLGEGLDDAWQAPLVRVFRALGQRRDQQVVQGTVQPRLQAVGAPAFDWPAEAEPAGDLAPGDAVRAADFQAALVGLIGFAAAPAADGASPKQARKLLRTRLDKLHRQLRHGAQAFEVLAPEAQHQVRKRLKRLRYLVEFVGACFDAKDAARHARQLEPAQDAMGAFMDELTAERVYRDMAPHEPRAWLAVGWLLARQAESAGDAGAALREAALKAKRFWR